MDESLIRPGVSAREKPSHSSWAWVALIAAVAFVLIMAFWVRKTEYRIGFQVNFKNNREPVLTNTDSVFRYNYNTAYLRVKEGDEWVDALAVRCQNVTGDTPDAVGPSWIMLSYVESSDYLQYSPITMEDILLTPEASWDVNNGVEDPRVWMHPDTQTQYMLYTAVTNYTSQGRPSALGVISAKLALATSDDGKKWTPHGAVFPDVSWSKSGAILKQDGPGPYYMFWGDCSICIATTTDFMNYTNTGNCLLHPRPGYFDSFLVESGPPPMKLSDGNYLFLYNSARYRGQTWKGTYDLEYNLGWAVLDGKDPTKVLRRADSPIVSPVTDWEKCTDPTMFLRLTPRVIFVEGMKELGPNKAIVWYQGCDASIGVFELEIRLG